MGQMVCSDLAVLRNYPPHLTPQKQVGAPATPWMGSGKAGPRAPAIKRGSKQSHYRGLCAASCCPRSQPGPALTPCGAPLGCLAHLCQWLVMHPTPNPALPSGASSLLQVAPCPGRFESPPNTQGTLHGPHEKSLRPFEHSQTHCECWW